MIIWTPNLDLSTLQWLEFISQGLSSPHRSSFCVLKTARSSRQECCNSIICLAGWLVWAEDGSRRKGSWCRGRCFNVSNVSDGLASSGSRRAEGKGFFTLRYDHLFSRSLGLFSLT